MSKRVMIYISISLVFGIVSFIATNNFIVTIIVMLISLLYFLIIANPLIKKSSILIYRYHECYRFINSFLISLNVKGSLSYAFDNVKPSMTEEYLSIIDGIKEMNDNEKLDYLSRYFTFHVYSLFLNIVSLWEEQGGDILSLSSYLINEARNVEEYLINVQRISRTKIIEFSSLWMFALLILIILRFALSQFFAYITNLVYYPIAIGLFFAFILFSIHILITKSFSYQIKGWQE